MGEATSIGITDRKFALRIVACGESERAGQEIAVTREVIIGREEGATIVLADSSVSRRHASVEATSAGLKVVDLGSGNGVWIGKQRVKEALLEPGQQFRVGSTIFECWEDGVAYAEAPAEHTMWVPLSAAVAAPPQVSGFRLRVVEPGAKVISGAEFAVEGQSATLGRSRDCTVVLDEEDISRRHAKIELTPSGFRITDLGSTCGVWVGDRQITSSLLEAGGRFRVGHHVVLECQPAAAAAAAAAEPEVVDDRTQFLPLPPAAPPAQVPAPEAPVPAAAAYMPAAPLPVPADLDSDATRVILDPEALAQARAVPAAGPGFAGEELNFDATVVIPAPADLLRTTSRIEDEGELVELSPHKPLLLNDPDSVWYVLSGGVLIFTTTLDKGQPTGPRNHFLGIVPGQCFFGFDLQSYESRGGLLAVAKPETKLRKISRSRMPQLAAMPALAPAVASLVETWVTGLSKTLARDILTKRSGELLLQAGETIELAPRKKATSGDGLLWVDIWSGSVLFDDLATPTFSKRRTLFPLTPHSWMQPVGEEFGNVILKGTRTAEAIAHPSLWHGLDVFHQLVCECEFINKRLAVVDEYVRLQQKAKHSDAAQQAAYEAIGSVLTTDSAPPRQFLDAAGSEPVLKACILVGEAQGIAVKPHASVMEEGLTFDEMVLAISGASGFRTRTVALRDDWWHRDHGPLLGQIAATKTPAAILPLTPRSYELVDTTTGERSPLTPEKAVALAPFAYTFYRPFPEGELTLRELLKFGSRGLVRDFRLIAMMGMILGVFGTITPFLTGQVFDVAIPQAERRMLAAFGFALCFSAVAGAVFRFTQGIATVRVQVRAESAVQGAVWDRLLNLPVNFFRKYAAGDLADRAAGVDQIQQLMSSAGVAAILGSMTAPFYLVQMFGYDLRLALLAVGLTLVFVSANTLANYLQLRHQRVEIQMKGRIAGLVLNLITGVSKLRITGSEQHAFRVWAQQFSDQRRISFKIGTIQSVAAVFSSIFPIISAIAIFMLTVSTQTEAAQTGAPGLSTGEFIAFNASYMLFLTAIQALADASLSLARIVPIYERLKPILATRPEVDSSKAYPGKLKGEIELSHVHFRYDPDGPWIVKDLSLKIKPGEFVAFVGSSGCGKSTLMRLMLGFETPSSGAIYFDGQDLSTLDLRMVRQQMGVVLQQSRVMPTEIYRNITGMTSRTVQDAWEAAEKAGLAEDIKAMPMGMHTYVSEGGGTLSGGQRQRLMIARAIVNRPKVLFLDEATSALDNKAQSIVTESMDRMDSTRIVIAHRLSTIVKADKICYLEAGRIVEMGPHQELMEKNGLFAQLARRQMA